ncbi:MAG: hypothetical protein ACOYK6_04350 [Chthoniobacterales bacterium]
MKKITPLLFFLFLFFVGFLLAEESQVPSKEDLMSYYAYQVMDCVPGATIFMSGKMLNHPENPHASAQAIKDRYPNLPYIEQFGCHEDGSFCTYFDMVDQDITYTKDTLISGGFDDPCCAFSVRWNSITENSEHSAEAKPTIYVAENAEDIEKISNKMRADLMSYYAYQVMDCIPGATIFMNGKMLNYPENPHASAQTIKDRYPNSTFIGKLWLHDDHSPFTYFDEVDLDVIQLTRNMLGFRGFDDLVLDIHARRGPMHVDGNHAATAKPIIYVTGDCESEARAEATTDVYVPK